MDDFGLSTYNETGERASLRRLVADEDGNRAAAAT
jgi:hypothetical protein